MVHRMADEDYRAEQWAHRYDPHVEPINRLVDELGPRGASEPPPYVAPMYRGTAAPLLGVLSSPSPSASRSGFLSVENEDGAAARLGGFFADAGIDPADVVPWNIHPWPLGDDPTPEQLTAGVEPLRKLIRLMPALRVIVLFGRDAQHGYTLFDRKHGPLVRLQGIRTLPTYSPGTGAVRYSSSPERAKREAAILSTLRRAAAIAAKGCP